MNVEFSDHGGARNSNIIKVKGQVVSGSFGALLILTCNFGKSLGGAS